MRQPSRLELAVRFRKLMPDESTIGDLDVHARHLADLIVDRRHRNLVAEATRRACLAECLLARAKRAGEVLALDPPPAPDHVGGPL